MTEDSADNLLKLQAVRKQLDAIGFKVFRAEQTRVSMLSVGNGKYGNNILGIVIEPVHIPKIKQVIQGIFGQIEIEVNKKGFGSIYNNGCYYEFFW